MQLLVSVIDAIEAVEAVAGGADIIDVKDPWAGALGAAPLAAVSAVRRVTPPHLAVSAALGDGPFEPEAARRAAVLAAEHGATFVKLGLRATSASRAIQLLTSVRAALPPATQLVVAGFADSARAGSPPPADLPGIAAAAGANGCLIDTAIKDGRRLLHWLDLQSVGRFVADCRARGLLAAVAGSLTAADLWQLAGVSPDIVGVRGAACGGDRLAGRVGREHVASLARLLAGAPDTGVYTTRVP